jgi:hypothetical protein
VETCVSCEVRTEFYILFNRHSVFKGLRRSELFTYSISEIGFDVIDYILVVCEFKDISYLRLRLLSVPHMLQSSL